MWAEESLVHSQPVPVTDPLVQALWGTRSQGQGLNLNSFLS